MYTWFAGFLIILVCTGQQATYNADTAQIALYYAYGAYCNASELIQWKCKWCDYVHNFTLMSDGVISDHKLQAYIGYDMDLQSIVVSFRGAEQSVQNWMDDYDPTQTLYPLPHPYDLSATYIHSESFDSWTELSNLGLTQTLQSILRQNSGSNVLLTGHSTGAVLAQITALELKLSPSYHDTSYDIGAVNVITFGSPRWCTQSVTQYFNDTVESNWRIVNKNDIVPTVPYVNMGDYGYYHTSTQIRYTDTLSYTQCNGNGENTVCTYIGYSMEDHLEYFGLHQDCSISDMNPSSTLDTTTTTLNETTNEDDSKDEIEIIYKFKKAASAGLSTISKIALCIILVIGYLLSILFCCCWYATHKQLVIARSAGDGTYFELNNDS